MKTKKNKRGFALLEYSLGAAALAGIVLGAVALLDAGLDNIFSSISNWLTNAGSSIGQNTNSSS